MTISGLSLLGINISGGEYGSVTPQDPGRLWYNYVLPSTGEIDYYAGTGMNVIRLPFLWERMQPVQHGALNADYLQQIDQVVAYAASKGMRVDLDLHNYGSYYGKAVGSSDVPDGALANVWGQLAAHYAQQNVIFGLMNEPSAQTPTAWAAAAAGAVIAIRAAGAATQEILVPGAYSDTASNWIGSGNAAALSAAIVDPDHNVAYEVHEYFDSDESGTHTGVVSPTIGAERLAAVTQWAEATGNRIFLGEFGAAQDAASLLALSNTLSYMDQHASVWQGGTYWAGGQWWGGYPFSVEPENGVDKPQMSVLELYEHRAVLASTVSPASTPSAVASAASLPGFDAGYYLLQNKDVAQAGVDPLQHFLTYGWHEGRNPDSVFDVGYYLQQNPDVKAAGMNPLLHYETYGALEGRMPSLVFDPAKYLAANTDVAAAHLDPLSQYVSSGIGEGRATFLTGGTAAADPLVSTGYYDRQLGASLIPAGSAADQQASASYAQGGWQAGRNPDALFDTRFYLAANPDVAAAHIDPLQHYEVYGWKEGRNPSQAFSTMAYLGSNTDVRAAGMDPLLHYVMYGQTEGRTAYPV